MGRSASISQKTSNPALTITEIRNNLTTETGSKIDARSIEIIFALYFGEYK